MRKKLCLALLGILVGVLAIHYSIASSHDNPSDTARNLKPS
jgi:hypothetical protein